MSTTRKTDQFDFSSESQHPQEGNIVSNDGNNGEKEKKLKEIRAQIEAIKQQIEAQTETKTLKEKRLLSQISDEHEKTLSSSDGNTFTPTTRKNKNRETETLEMVSKFKKRLREASIDQHDNKPNGDNQSIDKQEEESTGYDEEDDIADLDKVDGDEWLKHKFVAKDDTILAKDANTKDDDWYSVEDPRHKYHNGRIGDYQERRHYEGDHRLVDRRHHYSRKDKHNRYREDSSNSRHRDRSGPSRHRDRSKDSRDRERSGSRRHRERSSSRSKHRR